MRRVDKLGIFVRDYVRESKGRHSRYLDDHLSDALKYLMFDLPLPRKYEDHPLKGKWQGYRECHLRPNLLLVYRKHEPNILTLYRLGSHSELGLG